ncbi:MAG: hypothetical protein ACKVOT_00420 [Polaromonas sp.]
MASKVQKKEMSLLPKKVAAETLRIDGAGLRAEWLLDLLSERNVQMVEISPTPSRIDPQRTRLARTGRGQDAGAWLYPVASYMFVQLRLSNDGDSTCVADKNLPSDMQGRIRRSPFLPNTCLSLTISPKSTARFHLRYNPNHELGAPFSKWELFDHLAGTLVGSLTTSDESDSPVISRDFRVEDNEPYVALAALVDNRDAPRLPPYKVYQNRNVRATQHPFGSDPARKVPLVKSTARFVNYTNKEFQLVFGEQWERALDEARGSGWGNYGQQLVDQQNGVVLRLLFGQNIYVYERAADAGFYVFSGNWLYDQNNWLNRYDANGTLIWQITVTPPSASEADAVCSPIHVQAVRTTSDELILEERCKNPAKDKGSNNAGEYEPVRQIVVKKRDIEAALASP